jgi:hypothetical protein
MSTVERALGGPAIEVVAKATLRRFTLEYKRKIVREADGCKTPGAVSALLRREGLYSSHPATWRAARDRGDLLGVRKKRGRRLASRTRATGSSPSRRARSRGGSTAPSGPRPWLTPKKSCGVAGNPAGRRALLSLDP